MCVIMIVDAIIVSLILQIYNSQGVVVYWLIVPHLFSVETWKREGLWAVHWSGAEAPGPTGAHADTEGQQGSSESSRVACQDAGDQTPGPQAQPPDHTSTATGTYRLLCFTKNRLESLFLYVLVYFVSLFLYLHKLNPLGGKK